MIFSAPLIVISLQLFLRHLRRHDAYDAFIGFTPLRRHAVAARSSYATPLMLLRCAMMRRRHDFIALAIMLIYAAAPLIRLPLLRVIFSRLPRRLLSLQMSRHD